MAALCTLSGCKGGTAHTDPPPEEVVLRTADGFSLPGDLYVPDGIARPSGLILLHMYNSDRTSWEAFAQRARQDGFLCLAYDMRGHGHSTSDGWTPKSARDPWRDADVRDALDDIRYARDLLLERGANPDNLFIIGASIGANLALAYAKDDPSIQGVVMLSPGLTYKNLAIEKTMTELSDRPVLIMTAEGDSYAASSSATLKAVAQGYSELRTYKGTAHGTDLLSTHRMVIPQILQWLEPIVRE